MISQIVVTLIKKKKKNRFKRKREHHPNPNHENSCESSGSNLASPFFWEPTKMRTSLSTVHSNKLGNNSFKERSPAQQSCPKVYDYPYQQQKPHAKRKFQPARILCHRLHSCVPLPNFIGQSPYPPHIWRWSLVPTNGKLHIHTAIAT